MRSIKMVRLMIASLFITLSAVGIVHADKHSGQSVSDASDRAEQLRSQAEDAGEVVSAEKREKIRDKAGNKKDRHSDDDRDDDESDDQQSQEGDRDVSEADHAEKRDKARSKGKGAETKGNEKSQEMRARRDERKAIKEEYKSGRKSGESEDLDRPDDNTVKQNGRVDLDATNVEVDEKAKKPKKPWWKFWSE